jgi:hypothetical protein
MIMKPIAGLLIVIVALVAVDCCARAATAQESLTYVDLVKRMIDLEHLAVLPQPGETCKQWSSYDRASRYDEATGKYVDWGAKATVR